MDLRPVWEQLAMLGIESSEEMKSELVTFLDDLYVVNEHTNLTRVPKEDAPIRHIVDSLLVLPFIPHGSRVLDIGCGPGFPSWVIAWARPDCEVVAMDTTLKMQRFLGDHLRSNLLQRIQRAEENIWRESFDVVTGRALAPLGIQAELSAAWLKVGGIFVPFRTELEHELVQSANIGMLGLKLRSLNEVPARDGLSTRLFPVYEKIKATPPEYPRTWARMKAKPLAT
ncbi:MAG: class I SAM-dependent methyltransferase [Fimbriimonadaceae bacterium]|nr:MAG: class I SAM-dependent methyltransferase [Fimbriimonadaceae bacterium]